MGGHSAFGYCLLLVSLTQAAEYTIVDVQRAPVSGDAGSAIVRAVIPDTGVAEAACDVLVAGAGMGGIGAALAVARHNSRRKGGAWVDTPHLDIAYSWPR